MAEKYVVKIAPSILSADFGKLNAEIDEIEGHADLLHVDVMDGHFVPNLSFGAPVMKWIRTDLPMNAHLMISHPEQYVDQFAEAGASCIIFHVESEDDPDDVIKKIVYHNVKPGMSIKPKTPVSAIKEWLPMLEEVLIMTVEPGFSGQKFMEDMVSKITELREMGFEGDIAIDGGINAETAKICREAGANVLIAGSYVFKAEDRAAMIESLRE